MYGSPASYQSQAVLTADPARLVSMLYERVLVALARSKNAQAEGDAETLHDELVRAQDIIAELYASLDHDSGDPIARHLASLYEFCLDLLVRANVTKDLGPLHAVETTIGGLRESWDEACVNGQPLATVG